MTLMHGQPVPVGIPSSGPVCEECEKTIVGAAWCGKCHDKIVRDSNEEAIEEAAEEAQETQPETASRARDWISRRRLLFPTEVTKEVTDAFDLFIRDAEDGQC